MKKTLINIYLIIMLSSLLLGCSSVKTLTYIVNSVFPKKLNLMILKVL